MWKIKKKKKETIEVIAKKKSEEGNDEYGGGRREEFREGRTRYIIGRSWREEKRKMRREKWEESIRRKKVGTKGKVKLIADLSSVS